MFLIGDLGGTKVDIALAEENSTFSLQQKQRFFTKDYQNLESVIRRYLEATNCTPSALCFGIAGPTKEGKSRITNLPWDIDTNLLQKSFGLKSAWLINDLEAIAYGTAILGKDETVSLNDRATDPNYNQAVIAAGTGLGQAGLFWDGKTHRPFPTEGGHTNYGPRNELEVDLWRFISARFGHVSQERIVAGSAIPYLHEFLHQRSKRPVSQEILEKFRTHDPATVITEHALNRTDEICMQTIDLFIENYGSEAGNLALKMLARAGVFIGGGIAPKILPLLKKGAFVIAFKQKGRFEALLDSIPIKVITSRDVNLLGAARYLSLKMSGVY